MCHKKIEDPKNYLFLHLKLPRNFELHKILALRQEHRSEVHPLVHMHHVKPCPFPLDCALAVVRKATEVDGTSVSVKNCRLHTPNSELQKKIVNILLENFFESTFYLVYL